MLDWRDLKAIVRGLPETSALVRVMHPERHQWQLTQYLLADMADSLRWLVWSKTRAAQDGRDRPNPIPRPGLRSPNERIGTATGIGDMRRFLNW